MKYHKISEWDTANGKGIGIVLWVSGCEHHCIGCHNFSTWDSTSGEEFTEDTMNEILEKLSHPHIKRITLSGGDPLATYNRATMLNIAKTIKQKYPDKKLWCYTGYSYEDVKDLVIMNYIDVLVDGKFIQEQKDLNLDWCGSTNQRVIDIPNTLKSNTIVLVR